MKKKNLVGACVMIVMILVAVPCVHNSLTNLREYAEAFLLLRQYRGTPFTMGSMFGKPRPTT